MNCSEIFFKNFKNKILTVFYPMALLMFMSSCSKSPPESALENKSVFSFTMGARKYSFDEVQSARQYKSCGLQQIEIRAMNHADEFFKINITGDSISIRPGIYFMKQVPTNRIAGSCTFWYSGLGEYYTAKLFTVTIEM